MPCSPPDRGADPSDGGEDFSPRGLIWLVADRRSSVDRAVDGKSP
jgi:hypothetical protein